MASAVSSPDDCWQTGKSLADCLMYMFDNHVDCDVTFRIQTQAGSVQTVPAHKFMLVARSPVFEEMFRGNKEVASRDLNVEVEPFKEMMRYIYSDEVHFTAENVMHIVYEAKKYKINGLLQKATTYIAQSLSIDNAAGLFMSSIFYNESESMQECMKFMTKNTQDIIKTEGFTKMSQVALLKFLECDFHSNDIEVDIYQGCVEWAKQQLTGDVSDEEIRAVLGKCLHQIRFHQIPHDNFVDIVGSGTVLTAEEQVAVCCLKLLNNATHKEFLAKQGFNMNSRFLRFNRSSYTGSRPDLHTIEARKEVFELTADQPVYIHAISIFKADNGAKHNICVTIEDAVQKIICEHESEVTSVSSEELNTIFIPETKLESNVTYKISVMVKGCSPLSCVSSYYVTAGNNVSGVNFSHNTIIWSKARQFKKARLIDVGYIKQILISKRLSS